jgi:hypothetical protein
MTKPPGNLAGFSLCQFGDRLSRLVQCRKPLFERSDSVPKIVAARCENPRENRIGGVGSVKYPGAFLFGSNVAIEQLDNAIEIADHLPDLYRLSLRGFASIKMTLVSHWVLQNDPNSQRSARAPWILGRNRKNSAKGSAAQHSGEAGAKVYCEERCRYRHDRHEPANSHLERPVLIRSGIWIKPSSAIPAHDIIRLGDRFARLRSFGRDKLLNRIQQETAASDTGFTTEHR